MLIDRNAPPPNTPSPNAPSGASAAINARPRSVDMPPDKLARLFFLLGIAIMLGYILFIGRALIIPLVVAVFLSFLIVSLKSSLNALPLIGKKMPDWLGYIIAFALIALALIGMIDIIRSNVEALIAAGPEYQKRFAGLSSDLIARAQRSHLFPDDLMVGFDAIREQAIGMINPVLAEIGTAMRALAANIVTVLLYTIFMLIERGNFLRKIALISETGIGPEAMNALIADIGARVRQYISIKTIMALIVAGISYIIMQILGVNFAGFWALLIFALNFIPIIGSALAITLPSLLALVQPDGGGVTLGLMTFGLLVGTEQFFSSLIEPRLMGRSLNLSPLIILLALTFWGSLWGFAGMILSVPITVGIMIILTEFVITRPIAVMLSDNGDIGTGFSAKRVKRSNTKSSTI